MVKTYKIEVDCAACANKMEAASAKVEGVKNVRISFMTLKMTVEFDDGADEREVMKNVLKVCKKIERGCEIDY